MDLHEQGTGSRTFAIAAIVCVLLQAGLAPQISIAGGRVNFMIILVCLSVVVAIFGHALPSSILTGLVAVPFLMSGVAPQSGYGFSARGGRQTGMRFKPKTRKLK